MKKWTTLVLIVAIIMALFTLSGGKAGIGGEVSGAESDLYQVNKTTEHSEDWYLKQVESNLAYNAIINAFSERKGPAPDDGKFHQCTDGDLYSTDIPDYYGGSYLNTEADLVVLIKESAGKECIAEGKKFIESVCGSASIIFRNVRYSYAELLDGMSDLYNYCQSDQHKEDDFSIFSFCILQNQNGISVYTDTVDEKDLTRIRQSVRIPEALEFVCNDTGLSTTASANCGTAIGTSSSTMSISIGYPAKYTSNGSSIIGFVTCGHWFTSSTPSGVFCPSGYLGAVDPNKKMISGSVDGAFVQLQYGAQINHYIRKH